jgi:GMP synthase-like glutamine amidotransferase
MSCKNIQIFQHVAFEGPAAIEPFIITKGHRVRVTKVYDNDLAAIHPNTDALVVMGGPMSTSDEARHDWLTEEKRAISEAIQKDMPILGICLGAQLLAEALGASVEPMGYREIGWHRVETNSEFREHALGKSFPTEFTPLHWHGDRFTIPDLALPIGSSEACANQGFVFGENQIGLQFHLEFDQCSVKRLAENAADELDGTRFVHTEQEMLKEHRFFSAAEQLLTNFLDDFIKQID